jgi:hypothetical protein
MSSAGKTLIALALGFGLVVAALVWHGLRTSTRANIPGADPPLAVHLFVDPAEVVHWSRFRFVFDPPEVLQDLRSGEELDRVVAGAATDEQAWRRLMRWVRAQWEPGRPDPYPPPDARVILRDIRDGFTGGFCAQYSFVLVQAISSFGSPARCVTVRGHEVVEAWLRDENRWTLLDPMNSLQVLDGDSRSLDAYEIHCAVEAGERLDFLTDHRCTEDQAAYLDRYRQFAVWIRNDFVSRPLNFLDFDRYRVWFVALGGDATPPGTLSTPYPVDLYPGFAPPRARR